MFWRQYFLYWMLANFTVDAGVNLTNFLRHRQKRHLIYPGGGYLKLVVGPVIPINLPDAINWRTLLVYYNLHFGNYPLPMNSTDSYYFGRDLSQNIWPDRTREYFYHVLEYFLERQIGKNIGQQCLLRLICQNAQVHHHMTLFADILNIILTPGREALKGTYSEAYNLGRRNIDCRKRYKLCSKKVTFLDQIIRDLL